MIICCCVWSGGETECKQTICSVRACECPFTYDILFCYNNHCNLYKVK
uniref:Uncharacterized protein n=1 Tax=Anguilla anguilla TaxID=7936 RepID=A0A0E9T943_ANGAN